MTKGQRQFSLNILRFVFLVIATVVIGGCGLPIFQSHADKAITEIGEGFHTGLGRSSLEVILRRDGTAELTCTFYDLGSSPLAESMQVRSIPVCQGMFKQNPTAFVKKADGDLSGTFKGRIDLEQFDRLAKLVIDNGYLGLSDRYEEPGLMDAPPMQTWIVYTMGKKQVSDQADKGGPKLKGIEDAIYKTAGELQFK
ncbi:MAG: hypothetical protein ABI878_11515 [Acidobacteriota bacterium]